MRVGALRHQVTVERPVRAQDAAGAVTTTWTAVATPWAAVEPMRGQERFVAQQVAAEVSHKITLRYESALAGMTPAWRISFGSRRFDLLAVLDPGERNTVIECLAVERVT